jgi:hypothetical protein
MAGKASKLPGDNNNPAQVGSDRLRSFPGVADLSLCPEHRQKMLLGQILTAYCVPF